MTHTDDGAARAWTLHIPAPAPWLTANREHQRYQRGKLVRAWRRAVVLACNRASLPTGIHGPVAIRIVFEYAGRRPVRDTSNLFPNVKAIVDGLTPARTVRRGDGTGFRTEGYGFLVDDSDRHLVRNPEWELRRLAPGVDTYGRAVVTITDHSPATLFDLQQSREDTPA